MDSPSADGGDWSWLSAAIGAGAGALVACTIAQKRARDVVAHYEPVLEYLQTELAATENAYRALQAANHDLQVQLAAFERYKPILSTVAETLRRLPQPVPEIDVLIQPAHSVPQSSPAFDKAKAQALEQALRQSHAENRMLQEKLRNALREIERLGGAGPTDLPPYEYPDDSLPWSQSPQ